MKFERILRNEWPNNKKKLSIWSTTNNDCQKKVFSHTHSVSKILCQKSKLYDENEIKILVIDQVLTGPMKLQIKLLHQ